MTVHNYRSRQVHETFNGANPSNGFRDMRSAKSGPNLCQIWQVFGPWASLYGANGQMTMTVHNYRPRQFHRTLNGENPSRGYRDMGSASLAAARPAAHPPARPPGPWRQYPSSPEGWGVKNQNIVNKTYTALQLNKLKQSTLLVLKWEYSERTGSISRRLMAWLLSLPDQQQPQYWLCRINVSLSAMRTDFNYLHHLSVEEW